MGKVPDYFWFHYETTKNLKNIDFLFVTDDISLILDSPNYKIVYSNLHHVENILRGKTKLDISLSDPKKISDIRAALGDMYEEYLESYSHFAIYDIDTLFGDINKWIEPYIEKYDVISFGDEKYHNRLCGPFILMRNDEKIRKLYLVDKNSYVDSLNKTWITAWEEHQFNDLIKQNFLYKIIYDSVNVETENGGKISFESYWTGGKLFVGNQEKMLFHFYRKNGTTLKKIGNIITTHHKKILLDDFLWVVHFTENYEDLLPHLIESIKKYSNRKCVLYSINYTPKFIYKLQTESNQFIFRRIDIPSGDKDTRGRDTNILSSKPIILMDAIENFPNRKFVHIDTDIYLTTNSDTIPKYFKYLSNYPLMNSHIHDVMYVSNVNPNEEWTSPLHILLEEMGETNTIVYPRKKCNVIVFDEKCKWFLEEQMYLYNKYKNTKNGIFLFHDEDSANALLTKYQFTDALPLIDMEESYNLNMEKIYNYSYNMTSISPYVKLPKNTNDFLFFHGFKHKEDYIKIEKDYGVSVLSCDDMSIEYKNNTILFYRNSFLTHKKIEDKVDFLIYDSDNLIVSSLCDQELLNYSLFYISDIFLSQGEYSVEIVKSQSKKRVYKNILKVLN